MFTKKQDSNLMVLLVYVDDIIVTCNKLQPIVDLKAFLHAKFKIKDLGPLKYFFSLEVARSKQGTSLCQRKYT